MEPNPGGAGSGIVITWKPRFAENAYCDIVPQTSTGMQTWQDVAPANVQTLAGGKQRVQFAQTGAPWFFRLAAVRP